MSVRLVFSHKHTSPGLKLKGVSVNYTSLPFYIFCFSLSPFLVSLASAIPHNMLAALPIQEINSISGIPPGSAQRLVR